jgi:hypothetical protein
MAWNCLDYFRGRIVGVSLAQIAQTNNTAAARFDKENQQGSSYITWALLPGATGR